MSAEPRRAGWFDLYRGPRGWRNARALAGAVALSRVGVDLIEGDFGWDTVVSGAVAAAVLLGAAALLRRWPRRGT